MVGLLHCLDLLVPLDTILGHWQASTTTDHTNLLNLSSFEPFLHPHPASTLTPFLCSCLMAVVSGTATCFPPSIFTRSHWSEAQAFRRDFVHPWLPPGLATRQNELYGFQ
ncbi:hypothetical protein F5890DRAFT_1542752 [Lentinula detonsa]|uniref:Uncharacterized protein n=1 Tax=Lentinula detonsa TaxID=2804962 RepID=A0AA38PRY8_9AGAR|nr:hypothetical protein F5890DRAFT_1542752 [Lentinula detonsa]